MNKVLITIAREVGREYGHYGTDHPLEITVIGDPEPLAQILADGKFTVSYEVTTYRKVTRKATL